MSWITQAKCDVCGKLRGETNHWFELMVEAASNEVLIGEMSGSTAGTERKVEHICGQKCLHTRLDQWVAQTQTPLTEGADNHGNSNE